MAQEMGLSHGRRVSSLVMSAAVEVEGEEIEVGVKAIGV